jgi:hypothetical protein
MTLMHAFIQYFDEHDLCNRSIPPDVLGRACEGRIKQVADDAGAKAGEFNDDGTATAKRRGI